MSTKQDQRNIARQALEIARQEQLKEGESGYRMWEDITSPYSAKVRTYLHYKGIAFRRMRVTFPIYMGRIKALVGFPILPVHLTPDGRVMQDSTPILEWFEANADGPSCVPEDPRLAFIAWLLEDFADEYLVRFAMHYRWGNDLNRETIARRIARRMCYGVEGADHGAMTQMILARQSGFDVHLGLTDATRADMDAQLLELLAILEPHFAAHAFLLGDRPSVADFAFYGKLDAHLFQDPYSARLMEVHGPMTCNFLDAVRELGDTRGAVGRTDHGEFYAFDQLPDTIVDLLAFASTTWLPNGLACGAASVAREPRQRSYGVEIRGIETHFSTHHYRAWSFEQVQLRLEGTAPGDRATLDPVLERAGLLPALLPESIAHNGLYDGLTPPFVVDGLGDNRVKHRRQKAAQARTP